MDILEATKSVDKAEVCKVATPRKLVGRGQSMHGSPQTIGWTTIARAPMGRSSAMLQPAAELQTEGIWVNMSCMQEPKSL